MTDALALPPERVCEDPELPALSVLGSALHAVRAALVAVHPELLGEPGRARDPPPLRAARLICERAVSLERALARYLRVLDHARAPPSNYDDLPF